MSRSGKACFAVAVVIITLLTAALAASGRYKITSGMPYIKLDRWTGKTWLLMESGWIALEVFEPEKPDWSDLSQPATNSWGDPPSIGK